MQDQQRRGSSWREPLRIIIFEADTPGGKAFDVALLIAIGLSILAVVLESVSGAKSEYGVQLRAIEWIFTGLFSVEYALRLISVTKPLRYAWSFFGLIDLISILPSFLSLLFPGAQSLLVVRSIRLLRVFRIFKLARFLGEANILATALRSSRYKILVFLGTVSVIIVIVGTAMFLIEVDNDGFTSIPQSMYWTIVTMTTVGYLEVAPQTVAGQILASLLMILGYGIIAIPTGIVTAEIVGTARQTITSRSCPVCVSEGHMHTARFCRDCGSPLA